MKKEETKKEVEKGCNSCSNGCCRVPTVEKIGMEDGKPAGYYCVGYIPPREYPKQKRLIIKRWI